MRLEYDKQSESIYRSELVGSTTFHDGVAFDVSDEFGAPHRSRP